MDAVNKLFLKRQYKMILDPAKDFHGLVPTQHVATLMKNIEGLGFAFSKELTDVLLTYSPYIIKGVSDVLIPQLKEMVGANVRYNPMYPNFPAQVMVATDAELYINAILHYFGDWMGVRIMPGYETIKRHPLIEKYDLRTIGLGTKEEFNEIFTNLMKSTTSLSDSDKEDLVAYIHTDFPLFHKPTFKETLVVVAAEIMNSGFGIFPTEWFTTAIDVLRLATYLSGGDVSLATDTKFKSFSRKQRRHLLKLFDQAQAPCRLGAYRMKMIRLGERLHPGEYKERFAYAWNLFNVMRETKFVDLENSMVEQGLKNRTYHLTIAKLSAGNLARRLDHILRTFPAYSHSTLERFRTSIDELSVPVILQLLSHFDRRHETTGWRVFFPKGNVAKLYGIKDELPEIPVPITREVVDTCERALEKKFRERDPLGMSYIDPGLVQYLVPFSQRSASKALKTVVRGSTFNLNQKNTIRFFIHWKDLSKSDTDYMNRVDIDLSAVFFKDDLRFHSQVSYTRLRGDGTYHSGDITSAPEGASEFIDIDMLQAVASGARYIIMSVNSYSQQPYNKVPECFAGWMTRDRVQDGEIFDPRTVENKIDLTADSKIAIPMIIDMVNRSVIWCDLALTKRPSHQNNIHSNMSSMGYLLASMLSLRKPSLHRLFHLHAKTRGTITNDPDQANTIFSVKKMSTPAINQVNITPFDIEKIMGEFL